MGSSHSPPLNVNYGERITVVVLGGPTGVTTVAAGATYVVLGLAGAGAVVSAWTHAAKPRSAARSTKAYRMTVPYSDSSQDGINRCRWVSKLPRATLRTRGGPE